MLELRKIQKNTKTIMFLVKEQNIINGDIYSYGYLIFMSSIQLFITYEMRLFLDMIPYTICFGTSLFRMGRDAQVKHLYTTEHL